MSYPVNEYLCSKNSSSYRSLNVSAVYLNSQRKFSAVVLHETSGVERIVPKNSLSLKNIQIHPHGFELDVFYSEYWQKMRTSQWYHL